jgi:hypothetical protein
MLAAGMVVVGALVCVGIAQGSTPGTDVRVTNDDSSAPGYVSADQLAGVSSYTDATLQECSKSYGLQNEPAVEIDPRNSNVVIASSNDYCGVYNDGTDADGAPIASGPIWLGYYRSQSGGGGFVDSLVPGYPGDTSSLGALAQVRTATAGDPVIAWDNEGRVFLGSESSGDPAGTSKTFGDVFVARYVNSTGPGGATLNDGKLFGGSTVVDKGSSAPFMLGKFNDKTAIEVDRSASQCAGNVYFSWSRLTGGDSEGIYFSRSTTHGATFSTPVKLTASIHDVQGPDIAVTGNGHVYVTFRQYAAQGQQTDAVDVVESTDCGKTFSPARSLTTFIPYEYADQLVSGGTSRDCGDGPDACVSGYTYPRNGTLPRSSADQADTAHEWVHIVYEATVPGSVAPTGTTFGSIDSIGRGGQGAVYYTRYDGASRKLTTPARIDPETVGHQFFPDLSVSNGVLHAIWWDSHNDPNYSIARPVGNDASGNILPSLDAFASTRPASGGSWAGATRLSDTTTNPDFEQFDGRQAAFAGDYLWISSQRGLTYGVWSDWRDTVAGTDQRETTPDETGADVLQCRLPNPDGGLTGDTCPRDGGLDQNIYGDFAP